MATCLLQHTSSQLPSFPDSTISHRKRHLSDNNTNDEIETTSVVNYDSNTNTEMQKKIKTELCTHESEDKYQRHTTQNLFRSALESTCFFHSVPGFRRSASTCINSVSTTQSNSNFQTALPFTKEKQNMLVCQQNTEIVPCHQDTGDASIFISTAELAAYIRVNQSNPHSGLLILDCGSTFRYGERRIQNALLLDVNDKISRKRLSTRGLKSFLDTNQLNCVDQSQIIVLYDDAKIIRPLCSKSSITPPLSQPMKCVYDELKRYNNEKTIFVLRSTFDEFYQQYPALCYNEIPEDDDEESSSSMIDQSMDIDMYEMSEIIPGLYLGNARDAEDSTLLEKNHIQTVVNVSNTIPCFFENQSTFDYLRLACDDTHSQNILQHFDQAFQWMHKKLSENSSLLVHCQGGVSRSPSFVIGYLMKYHSKTFDQAYQLVKAKRTIINPNFNFLGQLTEYQRMLNRV